MDLSQREFAELIGLSTRRVRTLTAEGVLPRLESGRYGPAAVQAYIEHACKNAVRDAGLRSPGPYEDARADRMRAMAMLSQLELAEKRRDLLPTSVVESQFSRFAERVRSAIAGIPARWAMHVVGVDGPTEGQLRLRPLVQELLNDLAHDSVESEVA